MDLDRGSDTPADYERIGRSFCKWDDTLRRLGLPSLRTSMLRHSNAFLETDGCDEETLDPFQADTMNDVLVMVQKDPDRYKKAIDELRGDLGGRPDESTSVANRMEATMTFALLRDGMVVADGEDKPEAAPPAKRPRTAGEAEVAVEGE